MAGAHGRTQVALAALLVLWLGCGSRGTSGSTAAVRITAPLDAVHLKGVVTVEVESSGRMPDTLNLLQDGQSVATVSRTPYRFSWNSDSIAEGAHELRAQGMGANTNWLSDPITVNVDRTAPALMARSPAPADQNVDVALPIQLSFSEAMATGPTPDGGVVLENASGTALPIVQTWSEDGRTLTVRPVTSPVPPIRLQLFSSTPLLDLAGNAVSLPRDSWSWGLPRWQTLSPPPSGMQTGATAVSVANEAFMVGLGSTVQAYQLKGAAWVALLTDDAYPQPPGAMEAAVNPGGTLWLASAGPIAEGATLALRRWDGNGWSTPTGVPSVSLAYTASGSSTKDTLMPFALAADSSGAVALLIVNVVDQSADRSGPITALRCDATTCAPLPGPFASGSLFTGVQGAFTAEDVLLVGGVSVPDNTLTLRRDDGAQWTDAGQFAAGKQLVPGPEVHLVGLADDSRYVSGAWVGNNGIGAGTGTGGGGPPIRDQGVSAVVVSASDDVFETTSYVNSEHQRLYQLMRNRLGPWQALGDGLGGSLSLDATGRPVYIGSNLDSLRLNEMPGF